MSTETTPTTNITRLAAPRPRLKKLAREALLTADRASGLLPKVLDRIEERIPQMEDKQLVSAGHLLAGISQQRAQVAKAAGLLKTGSSSQQVPQTIVNVSIRADLPLEERIKLIQAEVSGVPRIEPLDVTAALPSVATPFYAPVARSDELNDLEPVQVSENPSAASTRSLQARIDDL